jgi:FSR family fosmidomycin resistance protein-like MFS transporter
MLQTNSSRHQWFQLGALAFAHFAIDCFCGLLTVLLPEFRERFDLVLWLGLALITTQNIASNVMQFVVGHLRPRNTRPLFIHVGLMLATCICLIITITADQNRLWLYLLVLVSGTGVAIFHPEALRAVHRLDAIRPATSSTLFSASGFMGVMIGSYLASVLFDLWGFNGLLAFLIGPAIAIPLIVFLDIELAVERHPEEERINHNMPFWPIYAITLLLVTVTTVFTALLPTRLDEMGYSLHYRGQAILFLGLGSLAGSLFWMVNANKLGELRCVLISVALGAPLYLLYLFNLQHSQAIWLLVLVGFFINTPYPLLLAMTRWSGALNLGQRMALMLGGTWGPAAIVVMGMGKLAEWTGLQAIMGCIWVCHPISLLIGIWLFRRRPAATVPTARLQRNENAYYKNEYPQTVKIQESPL